MRYNSLEEFVKKNNSKPCAMVNRNYEIYKERERGLTMQQIAIKFGLTRLSVINILSKK